MQTLIPATGHGRARYLGRAGRVLGFGLTARALLLAGCGRVVGDSGVLSSASYLDDGGMGWADRCACAFSMGCGLPAPTAIKVTRRFLNSPSLGERTEIEYEVVQQSNGIVTVMVTDDLHPTLIAVPRPVTVVAYPRDAVRAVLGLLSGAAWRSSAGKDLSPLSRRAAARRALGGLRCRAGCARVSRLGTERGQARRST